MAADFGFGHLGDHIAFRHTHYVVGIGVPQLHQYGVRSAIISLSILWSVTKSIAYTVSPLNELHGLTQKARCGNTGLHFMVWIILTCTHHDIK